MRTILKQIEELDVNESNAAKMKVPMELLEIVKNKGKLPVPNFSLVVLLHLQMQL